MKLKAVTKTGKLVERLRRAISDGELKAGDALLSETKMADTFGVSVVTARRAVKALVEAGLVETIHGKGTFVKGRRRFDIGLLYGSWHEDNFNWQVHFSQWLRLAGEAAAARGGHLSALPFRDKDALRELLSDKSLDGFLVIERYDALDDLAEARKIPVVAVGTPYRRVFTVTADQYGGARNAAAYLLSTGRRRIALFRGDMAYQGFQDRDRGFRDAMAEAGVAIDERWVYTAKDFGIRETGYSMAVELFEKGEKPDAVFCFSDFLAFGVLEYARKRGVRVPEDLAVMGFDDLELSAHTTPPLTTVRIPRREMIETAVAALEKQISHIPMETQTVALPCDAVGRQSA